MFCNSPVQMVGGHTICSIFQTKAFTPTSLFRRSSLRTVVSIGSTFSSSTTHITALFISGHVWVPRRGSPSTEPRPCTFSQKVKPRISNLSSIYSTRAVLAWLNTIIMDFIVRVSSFKFQVSSFRGVNVFGVYKLSSFLFSAALFRSISMNTNFLRSFSCFSISPLRSMRP